MEFLYKPKHFAGKLFNFYINLPNHPFKVRVENFFGKLFFPKGITLTQTKSAGSLLKLSPNDYITRHFLKENGFENSTMNCIMNIMKDGGNFLDIGANVGVFAISVAGIPHTKVLAIDASPIAFSILTNNISLNKYKNIVPVNAALSNTNLQYLPFGCSNIGNLGTSKVLNTTEQENLSYYYYVQTATLSSLLPNFSEFDNFKLLKIDVEGYEHLVLSGFPWSSQLKPEHIIAEAESNHSSENIQRMINLLLINGYEMYDVCGNKIHEVNHTIPDLNIWFQLKK